MHARYVRVTGDGTEGALLLESEEDGLAGAVDAPKQVTLHDTSVRRDGQRDVAVESEDLAGVDRPHAVQRQLSVVLRDVRLDVLAHQTAVREDAMQLLDAGDRLDRLPVLRQHLEPALVRQRHGILLAGRCDRTLPVADLYTLGHDAAHALHRMHVEAPVQRLGHPDVAVLSLRDAYDIRKAVATGEVLQLH